MTDESASDSRRMPRGVATGIGSMPGLSVRTALDIVTDVVPELIFLPELPQRGPGGEMVGRTFGLLNDVDVSLGSETQPSGWRFAGGDSAVMRRARSWLAEDIDALEESAAGHEGWIKVQVAGPVTLAASVELAYGERMISDVQAVRDLGQAVAAGVDSLLAQLRRRLPRATWVVQIDEPWLGGSLSGGVPTRSGLHTLKPLEEQLAADVLGKVAGAVSAANAVSWIHTCETQPPLALLSRLPVDLVAVDLSRVQDLAGLELLWEQQRLIGAGFATAEAGVRETSVVDSRMMVMERFTRHFGITLGELLDHVVVTPSCGLAYSENATAELRQATYLVDAMRSG